MQVHEPCRRFYVDVHRTLRASSTEDQEIVQICSQYNHVARRRLRCDTCDPCHEGDLKKAGLFNLSVCAALCRTFAFHIHASCRSVT